MAWRWPVPPFSFGARRNRERRPTASDPRSRRSSSTRIGQSGADGIPAAVLDTLDGSFIVRQIWDTQKLLTGMKAQLAAARGEQVTDSDLERELAELAAKFAPVLKDMTTRKDHNE
jgi:hypothetical protein